MIKPYQFIGYWGSSQEKLEAVLKKVLNKTANKPHIKVSGKSWGVAYIGFQRERSKIENDRGIIASISASGLANTSDAWVKVESAPLRGSLQDRLILGREPFGRVPLYWSQTEEATFQINLRFCKQSVVVESWINTEHHRLSCPGASAVNRRMEEV